jgi:hypothetical protein
LGIQWIRIGEQAKHHKKELETSFHLFFLT